MAKQTHIQISHTNPVASGDLFQYETIAGTQMGAVKSDPNNHAARKATVDQVREMKQDLRSAHFHFGNHQPDYLSAAKEALVSHDPSVST